LTFPHSHTTFWIDGIFVPTAVTLCQFIPALRSYHLRNISRLIIRMD
jgi:hypothetical protein